MGGRSHRRARQAENVRYLDALTIETTTAARTVTLPRVWYVVVCGAASKYPITVGSPAIQVKPGEAAECSWDGNTWVVDCVRPATDEENASPDGYVIVDSKP